jgi:hypothetical protein
MLVLKGFRRPERESITRRVNEIGWKEEWIGEAALEPGGRFGYIDPLIH